MTDTNVRTDRWTVEAEDGEVTGTYRVHVTADAASAYQRGDIEGVDALYERIRLTIEAAPELVETLRRIAAHEYRSDRRHAGMVDVSEVQMLTRTARAILARLGQEANG